MKEGVVQDSALDPLITDELVSGDRTAIARLVNVIEILVNNGHSVALRVLSDSGHQYAAVFERPAASLGAVFLAKRSSADGQRTRDGIAEAFEFTGLDLAVDDRLDRRLVEVYTTFTTPGGTPVVVEALYPYSVVAGSDAEQPTQTLSFASKAALLAAPQLVVFGALSSRRKRNQRERERLLERVIATSDIERRRIAASVHDGAVQDLMGVSIALQNVRVETPDEVRNDLDRLGRQTRTIVRGLRSLLSSIYPVEVPAGGWVTGLDDVVDALREADIEVRLDISPMTLAPVDQLLLLRVAREALRNIHAHARATSVSVVLDRFNGSSRLTITDNGLGFDASVAGRKRRAGHLGLELIRDLAEECGASLTIDSPGGGGTTVRLVLQGHP